MNVLVTGSEGFIGKALVTRLRQQGHTVLGFDLAQDDVTGPHVLDRFIGSRIDHLFHLAGKTFVPDSWRDPQEFYRVNVMGTVEAVRFCKEQDAGLTYISSYLYGQPAYLPIDEQHPLSAYNPYSHSKLMAEEIVRYQTKEFDLQTTILRPFNAYGPGQPLHFLIPEIITGAKDPDTPVILVNDLRPKRDYIYIDDLVEAMVLTLTGSPGIYNVGSGGSTSVEELIQTVLGILGSDKPYQGRGKERTHEIFDLYAGISRIRAGLGWEPKTSIREGIKACIEFSR